MHSYIDGAAELVFHELVCVWYGVNFDNKYQGISLFRQCCISKVNLVELLEISIPLNVAQFHGIRAQATIFSYGWLAALSEFS